MSEPTVDHATMDAARLLQRMGISPGDLLSGAPVRAAAPTAACIGRGRPPRPAYPDPPVTFKDLVLAAGRSRPALG